MNANALIISSSVTAGIIAGGGALIASMADGGAVTINVMIAAGVTFLIAAAKDWRTYIAKPPTGE